MPPPLILVILYIATQLAASVAALSPAPTVRNQPIFFFHGIVGNASNGDNLKANLSSEARPFVALSFCENACSFRDLNAQVQLAIKQIRDCTTTDTRFDQGYVFLAASFRSVFERSVYPLLMPETSQPSPTPTPTKPSCWAVWSKGREVRTSHRVPLTKYCARR